MSQAIDLTGKRFGKLKVIKRDLTPNKKKSAKWICQCDCGTVVSVIGTDLRSGHTKSCGCYHKEQASRFLRSLKSKSVNFHKSKTKSYRIWHGMMRRCYNEKTAFFEHYGGRGIRVCERWHQYHNFLADMGEAGPLDTLNRIDCNGDYQPSNCRWATMKEQASNRRSTIKIEYEGNIYSLKQFARHYHISYYYVRAFYHRGLTPQQIIKLLENKRLE